MSANALGCSGTRRDPDRDMVAALASSEMAVHRVSHSGFFASLGGACRFRAMQCITRWTWVSLTCSCGGDRGSAASSAPLSRRCWVGAQRVRIHLSEVSIILVFLVMAAVLIVRPWGLFEAEAAARRTPG